ncbi:MAG: double-strand break repair protein AddB, partial [Alphaproteobacteria bacterium]|nr:double-strand break repair protein AddB [Alphaproteobacteria bacterium]
MNIRGLYTIPAAHNFAESLAGGLLQETKDSPEELARYLILLPTRRACRNVQAAFLKLTDGKPLLLPRLQPIGDIDQDELSLHGLVQGNEQNQGQDIIHIPEAMPPMQRQILLSRLISALPDFSNQPGQNMTLAAMLGQLMDQIYTEDLDIQDLPSLIDNHELSEHWQITTKFLEVLSKSWPEILAEKGLIDTADRRNRLLKALNSLWQQSPPGHPVIIAGSTGSIPATAVLMKTALSLPRGSL